jgi:hypothetical protein
MSQHKFASNVVEKCLEFGGPAERQILIDEMLGLTDENEPLQVGFIHIIYEVGHKITMDILGHPLQRINNNPPAEIQNCANRLLRR